jgi:hypothetical protein
MNTRSTLVGLAAILLVIAVASAVLLVTISRSVRRANVTSCASNLKSLWTSQFNYAAQYGRPDGKLPEATGSDFFLALQRTPKPMISRHEPFICPLSDETPGPGKCSYRGPAFPLQMMEAKDPVSADKEGNHGPGRGGNVFTKTGDVIEVEESDPIWLRARTTTKE